MFCNKFSSSTNIFIYNYKNVIYIYIYIYIILFYINVINILNAIINYNYHLIITKI